MYTLTEAVPGAGSVPGSDNPWYMHNNRQKNRHENAIQHIYMKEPFSPGYLPPHFIADQIQKRSHKCLRQKILYMPGTARWSHIWTWNRMPPQNCGTVRTRYNVPGTFRILYIPWTDRSASSEDSRSLSHTVLPFFPGWQALTVSVQYNITSNEPPADSYQDHRRNKAAVF